MASEPKKPSRKMQDSRESMLALFAGLMAAGYFKLDAQVFFAFVAGIVGKSGVFNWGVSKEYDANQKVEVAKTGSSPAPTTTP